MMKLLLSKMTLYRVLLLVMAALLAGMMTQF